ncbi:MAG: peptide chain release factor 2 [Coriobacteriales bacterium]|nr:peptide chain release factor 2 [Coriobacteriales bacterium]
MIETLSDQLQTAEARLLEIRKYLAIDAKRDRQAQLESATAEPGFWDDQAAAQGVMSEIARLRDDISSYDDAFAVLEEAMSADELAVETDDQETAEYARQTYNGLVAMLDQLELSSWFTGKFDHGDAIVTVKPGQGGLEAQDWTEMLFKMYLRYCERRKWKVQVNDAPVADVIGLDRATFTVSGKDAYGMLAAEAGVHRLVRISPTDEKKRRQTTFAGVEVLPILPDDVEVDINPADLRIDVYHASGPGGQGVNTTDSAVRITHMPTGTVVTCQNERSQLQNKATAMQILRSRLYELELEKRAAQIDELRGPKHTIGFGNQIRSYVLYPYQMIKDLRTGHETSNIDDVLVDGDLDPFIIAYHRWRVLGESQDDA